MAGHRGRGGGYRGDGKWIVVKETFLSLFRLSLNKRNYGDVSTCLDVVTR